MSTSVVKNELYVRKPQVVYQLVAMENDVVVLRYLRNGKPHDVTIDKEKFKKQFKFFYEV